MREEGWLNDLNGLVYHAGEYHLFAQRWNKCWIHAVSTDLVHWTELPPAFWEDHRFGGGVQSGGAVVDHANTSGLSPDPRTPPMVAFWSGNDNFSTCIAYSLDRGRTWTKYAKNPVLRHPERDPKVFWHEPSKRWVLVLSGGGAYFLFTSTNLLDWTELKRADPPVVRVPGHVPAACRRGCRIDRNGCWCGATVGTRWASSTANASSSRRGNSPAIRDQTSTRR